jgi:hypothetical protein
MHVHLAGQDVEVRHRVWRRLLTSQPRLRRPAFRPALRHLRATRGRRSIQLLPMALSLRMEKLRAMPPDANINAGPPYASLLRPRRS